MGSTNSKFKWLSCVIAVVMILCVGTVLVACNDNPNGGNGGNSGNNGTVDHGGVTFSTLTFGSYPQSEVTDATLTAALADKAGTLPNEGAPANWTDYGYYLQGEKAEYMWYIDLEHDGAKYRGVYFTSYRPYFTGSSSNDNEQEDNGYKTEQVYWFKWEPITWRVLEKKDGEALIMADLILDSQAFQNEYTSKYSDGSTQYYTNSNGAPEGTYANNYRYSTIRSWLNDTFYNQAFTQAEKDKIKTTTVDNSVATTTTDDEGNNKFACENTQDKVFLLSFKDVFSPTYGLDSMSYEDLVKRYEALEAELESKIDEIEKKIEALGPEEDLTEEQRAALSELEAEEGRLYDAFYTEYYKLICRPAKMLKTSAYAQVQGAYTYRPDEEDLQDAPAYALELEKNAKGCGWWWLRSPYFSYSDYALYVYYNGSAGNYNLVYYTNRGVVPALRITL